MWCFCSGCCWSGLLVVVVVVVVVEHREKKVRGWDVALKVA